MKLGADDFKQLYASMPDEELLSLIPDELTPVARECYEAELLRRSLTVPMFHAPVAAAMALAEDPEIASLPGQSIAVNEDQEEEDLAAAASFAFREEAKSARVVLQAAGIPSFVENDMPSGFRLLVPASYVEQAREILAAPPGDGEA